METGMLFETRAGPLRLRWNERGLTAIEMPELPPRALRAELAKQRGAEVPPFAREAARLLERHLAGEAQALAALPLDLSVLAPFQRAVYEKVRTLPPGRTATYGEIAALLGKPGASRAVGQALGRNPFLVAVPCHRVLGAGGAPGGFSAPGGVVVKQRLLALEGVMLAVMDIRAERRRGAGLSRSKTAALKDLAAKARDGTVPASARGLEKLSDDEIVERLTAVRGIGRWTVEMLLIFRLARPDVLPATDYGVRKGFARVRGASELPAPKELLAYGERWRPYRSVASWYLWRVLD